MDRMMAAALDRYLTTPPEPPGMPGIDFWYHCSNACGAFLPFNPDMYGSESHMYRCPGMPNEHGYDSECDKWRESTHGPHWFFYHFVTLNFRWCRKCGYRNTEVIF